MKNKLILLVLTGLGLSAQAFNHVEQQKFDAVYWAAQPPEVRALKDVVDNAQAALELAVKGFVIDFPVLVAHFDPYATMFYRGVDGFTWVPSGLQPSVCVGTPYSNNPPYCPYDPAKPPEGSIKVSLDVKDYPAFDPPVPPQPAPSARLVGLFNGAVYTAGPDALKDGKPQVQDKQVVEQDDVKYIATVRVSPFGFIVFYTKAN